MHEEHRILPVFGVLKMQTKDLQNVRGACYNDPDDLWMKINPCFLGYSWFNVRKKKLCKVIKLHLSMFSVNNRTEVQV